PRPCARNAHCSDVGPAVRQAVRQEADVMWIVRTRPDALAAMLALVALAIPPRRAPVAAQTAETIAGDDNRAASAFLGTETGGDAQAADFLGVWHLYVAFTYNGGRTWTTSDATPGDPVQRGCIWNGGGSNPCRNLLDFNDITVDQTGRVLVGYADGCTGACVTDPTQNPSTGPASAQDAPATGARQVGGRGL